MLICTKLKCTMMTMKHIICFLFKDKGHLIKDGEDKEAQDKGDEQIAIEVMMRGISASCMTTSCLILPMMPRSFSGAFGSASHFFFRS